LLADLVASGRIKPVIEKRYDLAGVPEALEYIEAGHLRGKLAIASTDLQARWRSQ